MIMRNGTRTLVAVSALLFAGVSMKYAMAASPEPNAPLKVERERDISPAEMAERNAKLYQEWLKARKEQSSKPPVMPDRDPSGATGALEARVEKYVDSAILYSVPLDPAKEHLMLSFGYRKVDKQDHVGSKTIFGGRVYNILRVKGEASKW